MQYAYDVMYVGFIFAMMIF